MAAAFKATKSASLEAVFLDQPAGRQMLHTTFGAVLTTGRTGRGRPFREAILDTLEHRADLYREILDAHMTRHLMLLNQG